MKDQLFAELDRLGLVSPSTSPHLAGTIQHHERTGQLTRILGNSYAATECATSFEARVAAARVTYPSGIFIRETAARMSWWTDLPEGPVQIATPERSRPGKGFVFERRDIPAELRLWTGEHFVSSPALTVLDLTDTFGGRAIDEGLRRGVVTLQDLHDALALTKGRRGNKERARLLFESRAEPWSPLERDVHVLLRQAHFPGWVANHEVVVNDRRYFLDIAVPEIKLGAEIDGWEHHNSFQSFVHDREKWTALVLAGWTMLTFTASSIKDLTQQMRAGVLLAKSR